MAKYSKTTGKEEKIKTVKVFAFLSLFVAIAIGIFFVGGSPTVTTFMQPGEVSPLFAEGPIAPIKIMPGTTGMATYALFDISLNILPESIQINSGENLLVSVSLTNFGSEGPTDASLAYIITDSKGYVVFIEHEKRIVETQESFLKTLELPGLDTGIYQLYSELLYSNTSAIASEKFKVA